MLFRAKRAYENIQKNKKVEHSRFQSNHAFEKRLVSLRCPTTHHDNRAALASFTPQRWAPARSLDISYSLAVSRLRL